MAKLQVYIFHYHLLPGGVTDVITGWLRILARYSGQIFPRYQQLAVRICCGKPDNVALLQRQWRDFLPSLPVTAQQRLECTEFLVDGELDYKGLPRSEAFARLPAEQQALAWQGYVQSLAVHLLLQYSDPDCDCLWWVHNYHLGKNIAYTKALLQIIEAQFPLTVGFRGGLQNELQGELTARTDRLSFLLHIHDFAECGRFARYNELLQSQQWLGDFSATSSLSATADSDVPLLYSVNPKVCYGTINQRDYRILLEAGLCRERLFFLPNPLEFRPQDATAASAAVPGRYEPDENALRSAFARDFKLPAARAEKLLALYPVRCIRRKNVLELAFLNLLAGEPWNLICTLPGRSTSELAYSALIEKLYRDGLIQGLCNVGLRLEERGWSFDMLCRAASLLGSSSVMEGFGFTYFNPMYRGKALVARRLDVLRGFEHCFDPELALFYDELKLPLYPDEPGSEMLAMYRALRRKYQSYIEGLPAFVRTGLHRELVQRLPAEPVQSIDFALLDSSQQQAVLKRLRREAEQEAGVAAGSRTLLRSCQAANRELLERLQDLLAGLEQQSLQPGHSEHWQHRQVVRQQIREKLSAEFAPSRLAAILQQAVAPILSTLSAVPPQTSRTGWQAEQQKGPQAEIGRRVLRSFSKLEYNYALLWDKPS